MKNEYINLEIQNDFNSCILNGDIKHTCKDFIKGDYISNMSELELWEKKNFLFDDDIVAEKTDHDHIQTAHISIYEIEKVKSHFLKKRRNKVKLNLKETELIENTDKFTNNKILISLFEEKLNEFKNQIIVKWLSSVNYKYEDLSKF